MKNNEWKTKILEHFEFHDYSETKKLACYLISLFYKSGCKYSCSRPKINRLLTIYKLSSVNFDPECFNYAFNIDTIYMMVRGFVDWIPTDVYLKIKSEDNKEFFDGDFNEVVSIPECYNIEENLIRKNKKDLLEIIFRKFASYSVGDLGKMIDELHHNIPFEKRVDVINHSYNYLDPNKFSNFLNSEDNNLLYQNNEVFNFIKIIVNVFEPEVFDNNEKTNHVLKLIKN